MIKVIDVTKTYGKGESLFTALYKVSTEIPAGASVAIIGKSGSGKSTLMHIMSGLDRPSDGEVIVNGKSLVGLKPKQVDAFRSSEMSFIFQAFFIEANQTCYQNVLLPLEIAKVGRRDRRKHVLEALRAVDLEDKVDSLAGNLSGGQKQRLAIARAIVNNPKLLFADEPTGNLDSATGDIIIDLLFKLNRERKITLVIVTHDLELAQKTDIQIYLKDGEIEKTVAKKRQHRTSPNSSKKVVRMV
ncbi:MAG: putative transport system ATP-binding protein [Patescibacteria group bacterium]|jgi:putative ABC transport system ATP-binding protein|nr:putative transport system ATP-binding protein [Patescibacteria group bacterium]